MTKPIHPKKDGTYLPLLESVKGNQRYKDKLDAFCRDLLKQLLTNHTQDQKHRMSNLLPFLKHLTHTIAYIASRPSELKYIGIARDRNRYGKGGKPPYATLSYAQAMKVLDLMLNHSTPLIIKYAGGHFNPNTQQGKNTKYEPSLAFKDQLIKAGLIFEQHPYGRHQSKSEYDKTKHLRIKHNEDSIEWLDRDLKSNERVLASLSEKLLKLNIAFKYEAYSDYEQYWDYYKHRSKLPHMTGTQLFRSFSKEEGIAGRIYGHWVQNCSNSMRKFITFNRQPTVELDYKSMHLFMLYGLADKTPPQGDLYSFNPKLDRDMAKSIFTISLGAVNKMNAIQAIKNEYSNTAGYNPLKASSDYDSIWEYHSAVSSIALQPEIWKTLQTEDSEIMLNVLTDIDQLDIIAIPIHDSVLVLTKHEAIVREIMINRLCEAFPVLEGERDRLIG